MDSIRVIGLRVPINVKHTHGGPAPVLISGAHRLESLKRLGVENRLAFVFDGDDGILAAIAEIDENMIWRNLS